MNHCPTGKQPYPTANAVWRVIQCLTSKAALHTHKYNGKPGCSAYRCPTCGQWHMTKKDEIHRRHEPVKARPRQWHEEARG